MCGVNAGGLLCGTSIESIESIKSIESIESIESAKKQVVCPAGHVSKYYSHNFQSNPLKIMYRRFK